MNTGTIGSVVFLFLAGREPADLPWHCRKLRYSSRHCFGYWAGINYLIRHATHFCHYRCEVSPLQERMYNHMLEE